MAKRENTQKKKEGAQNNCGKTQGNQERGGRRHTKATGQNTGKAAPKLLQAKCVGKFLTARGYNNVAKRAFFLRSAQKSAPAQRSMLHFSLMAVALLLCQKN